MTWDRKRDRVKEAYVANIWAKKAGVEYLVTPNEERYDIEFFDEAGAKVLAEVKVRREYFPSWFVEEEKSANLLKKAKQLNCTPWYLIYCQQNRYAYKLNLLESYPYEETIINGSWGKLVPVERWHYIPTPSSVCRRMTSIDFK